MSKAQATYLPDGKRLHLHHGPIDMIVGVEGPGRASALSRAAARFGTLLEELTAELLQLRSSEATDIEGETAKAMLAATAPFRPAFITPMAAVAGAGADTILRATRDGEGVDKAYVNNGGDVGFHLSPGRTITAAIAGGQPGRVTISHDAPVRGVATSGWRGRSHSLGIADSVTVLARSAAEADAAATMIANAVDLPGHPVITRAPANRLAPDSDLGARPVTTAVGPLDDDDVAKALDRGASFAETCRAQDQIHAAALMLGDQTRIVGALPSLQQRDPIDA